MKVVLLRSTLTGSSALVIGLCVGGVLFCLLVGLILLLIQRGKSRNSLERHTTLLVKRMPEKPLTLKKPTPAVKAHTGVAVAGGVVLKKSPSPTGSKSPPGSSSNYASPVDQEKAITSAGKKRKDSSDSAVSHNSLGSTKVSPDCDASAADSSILHKIFSASEPRAKEGEVRSLTSSSDSPCVRAKVSITSRTLDNVRASGHFTSLARANNSISTPMDLCNEKSLTLSPHFNTSACPWPQIQLYKRSKSHQ